MADRAGVLLAGGGTAGHVNPLLALAAELRRRDPELPLAALGTAAGLESQLVPAAGLALHLVPRVPLPRRPTPDLLRLPVRLRAAIRAAGEAMDAVGAGVVVGFGGYVSTPAYLAARGRRVPVVVHEANARPGLANRIGARDARYVAATFPGTPLRGARLTGMPLRAEITDLAARLAADRPALRAAAAATLGLDPALPTLLVTGGSLGAQRINAVAAQVAPALLGAGAQVLHLAGAGKADAVREAVAGGVDVGMAGRYRVVEYLHAMADAYAVADLVLCRAGAATVSELAALGLPAVYVPLPVGNGEQRLNAEPVVAAGGGLLVADRDLTAEWVASVLVPLLADRAALDAMAVAAAGAGTADGAARLADLVLDALAEPPA